MAAASKVRVIEITGGSESLQTAIQNAINALSPAASTTVPVNVAIHGTSGRYVVILSYVTT